MFHSNNPFVGGYKFVKFVLLESFFKILNYRFKYISFPLALVCLSEVTILTFGVISAMVKTAQQIV